MRLQILSLNIIIIIIDKSIQALPLFSAHTIIKTAHQVCLLLLLVNRLINIKNFFFTQQPNNQPGAKDLAGTAA